MSTRERVKQPPWADEATAAAPASLQQLIQPDATAAPAPWQTHTQQGDLPSTSTEVGQFEPLPDSPTGNRTAAGRVFDQQHDSQELQQQKQRAVAQQEVKKADSWVAPAVQPQLRATPATMGPPPGTAHVHLIGEITGAVGLGPGPLYCTWQLVYDTRLWSIAGGLDKGRTHASSPLLSEDGSMAGVVWECPMDVLLTTSSMQHWPSIVFKLFHRSIWLGRDEFVGYSLCSLPNTPGCHHVSCPVWVAAEAGRSLPKELTKFFTGLHPQLVDESFITDLEQRFEQGQHLHTVACSSATSSSHDSTPLARSMVCTGGPCAAGDAAAALRRPHCSSISAASRGTAAVTGSGICLRLHVLTRGLQQLSRLRGDGVESIGRCLERLHSNVEKMRKQHARPKLQDLVGVDSDDEGQTEESAGTQLVREGRAARLESVHQQLFGRDSDRDKDRDQKQLQQLQPASRRLGLSSPRAAGAADAAGGSPGRLRSLASLADGSSARSSQSPPVRRLGAEGAGRSSSMAAAGQGVGADGSPSARFRPSGDAVEALGGPGGSGSPLRRDAAAVSNRWAGRFASSEGQAPQGSPVREELLPPSQERS